MNDTAGSRSPRELGQGAHHGSYGGATAKWRHNRRTGEPERVPNRCASKVTRRTQPVSTRYEPPTVPMNLQSMRGGERREWARSVMTRSGVVVSIDLRGELGVVYVPSGPRRPHVPHAVERVISDNAFIYRHSAAFLRVIQEHRIEQKFIKPHCPCTNGKVERLNRRLAT